MRDFGQFGVYMRVLAISGNFPRGSELLPVGSGGFQV